jgi:hypothetical protein
MPLLRICWCATATTLGTWSSVINFLLAKHDFFVETYGHLVEVLGDMIEGVTGRKIVQKFKKWLNDQPWHLLYPQTQKTKDKSAHGTMKEPILKTQRIIL